MAVLNREMERLTDIGTLLSAFSGMRTRRSLHSFMGSTGTRSTRRYRLLIGMGIKLNFCAHARWKRVSLRYVRKMRLS